MKNLKKTNFAHEVNKDKKVGNVLKKDVSIDTEINLVYKGQGNNKI